MPNECQICADKTNKSTRKEIKCLFCNEICCKSCILGNIKANWEENPNHCLFCKEDWDLSFWYENFTKKEIDEHFRELIFKKVKESELAILPSYQEKAKLKLIMNENSSKINQIKTKIKAIKMEIEDLSMEHVRLLNENDELHAVIYNREQDGIRSGFKLTIKCPKDGCKYLLDDKYHCEFCDINFCPDCLEEIEKDNVVEDEDEEENTPKHICNKETLETIKEIKKNSKPCPGCGTNISKIDGCDQMWCPICKKGFSWRTGKIETGRIHNPEYFRWMQEHGTQEQENNQVPERHNNCVFPQDNYFISKLRNYYLSNIITEKEQFLLINAFRLGLDLEHIIERNEVNIQSEPISMRIDFLNNIITEEKFNEYITKKTLTKLKLEDFTNINRLVKIVILENSWKIVEFGDQPPNIIKTELQDIISKFIKIRDYANQAYAKHSSKKMHGGSKMVIDELTWRIRT